MKDYEELIGLPHHVSDRHARMSMHDRAAQFSPFAALTGYDAAIRETARLTDERAVLDDSRIAVLDRILREAVEKGQPVRITRFREDGRKSGGAYLDEEGTIKRIDRQKGMVVMAGGQRIPVEDIADIEILSD